MRSKVREIDIQPADHLAFIHIPKTAGSTFNTILEPLLAGLSSFPAYFLDGLVQSELEDLRNFQVFRGHLPYALFSDIIFPEGFIGLTFLRDPVERTASNYRFIHQLLKRDGLRELAEYADEIEEIRNLSLAEFLERTDLRINKSMVNFQTGFLGSSVRSPVPLPPFLQKLFSWKRSVTQARYGWLRSRVSETPRGKEDGEMTRANLNIAKKRLQGMAFLGLVERFQESLFLLSYTFGWRPILDSTRLNVTSGKDYSQPADAGLLRQLRDRVNLDLELYQFGQEVFETRYGDMAQALLRRYGNKEHARLSWPLPAELMVQMLEQNYLDRRDCRGQRKNSSAAEYLYRPAMKVEGPFGWYKPEFSPEHGFMCWSGPGLHSGFDLPCPSGADIQVSFRVLMALRPEIILQLALSVNNIFVPLRHAVDLEGAYIFTGDIPTDAISGRFLRLVFMVPITIVPCTVDPDNLDPRPLGILLNWVKLQGH